MVCDIRKDIEGWKPKYGLNPYSIGIWSATEKNLTFNDTLTVVLILILLEYGLRPIEDSYNSDLDTSVLILILLEYGLRLL